MAETFPKKFNQNGKSTHKASHWNGFDGEGRKLGEQPGLDTPLVLAVNDARLVLHVFRGHAVP